MVAQRKYLLVIAGSARMLAQAAVQANFKPLVIDLYADADTQHYAAAFRKVPSLAQRHLAVAVEFFIKHYPVEQAIYGSGFEYHPDSLHYLNDKLTVFGNLPDVFQKAQDKTFFFNTLADLAIPYPEVRFTPPDSAGQWLLKPKQGQGGLGIKPYTGDGKITASNYWQQYQTGVPHSVLFLADGKSVQVIGFNRQWTVNLGKDQAFAFAGVINHTDLTDKQRAIITTWLTSIVPAFGLRGLNSLDFIQAGEQSLALEINPRLSASMQLYDARLLDRHIKASHGRLEETNNKQTGYSGYQIIYAVHDVIIPRDFPWPSGCVDLPAAGVICRKGQPICSIIAHHKQAPAVMEQLGLKQQTIFKQLQIGSDPHGIPS